MGDEDKEEMGDDAEEVEDEVMDMMDEPQEEAVEYDLDESEAEDEVVEEATKLSDKVAEPKGGDADNNDSGVAKKGVTKVVSPNGQGEPVKTMDGGDGDSGDNSPKDSGGSDNLNVEPKKV